MSTQQRNNDSSLNNEPERDARKLATSGTSGGSSSVIGSGKGKEGPIPTDTYGKSNAPIDKHGDTWGGGISGHNNQFK